MNYKRFAATAFVAEVAAGIDGSNIRPTRIPLATPGALIGGGIGFVMAGGSPLLDAAVVHFGGQS